MQLLKGIVTMTNTVDLMPTLGCWIFASVSTAIIMWILIYSPWAKGRDTAQLEKLEKEYQQIMNSSKPKE